MNTRELLSDVFYAQAFHASSDAIALLDAETTKVLDINPAACRLYGYSRQEAMELKSLDFSAEPEKSSQVFHEKKSRVIPVRWNKRKDGTVFPVELAVTFFRSGDRSIILSLSRDITERVALEAAIRYSEQRWQLALEMADEGIWDWDIANRKVYRSARWKMMLGYLEHEIGDSLDDWEKLVHPDDLLSAARERQEHLDGKSPKYDTEQRMLCRDGQYRWFRSHGRAVRDEAGFAKRMIGFFSNIQDQKIAEERILFQNRLLAHQQAVLVDLARSPNKEILLRAILERSAGLVGASKGYVATIDDNSPEGLAVAGTIGIAKDVAEIQDFSANWYLGSRANQTGQVVIEENAVAVPIKIGDRVAGIIELMFAEEAAPLGTEKIDALRQFAAIAALSLENADLFLQTKQAHEQIRQLDKQARRNELLNALITGELKSKSEFLKRAGQFALKMSGSFGLHILKILDWNGRTLDQIKQTPQEYQALMSVLYEKSVDKKQAIAWERQSTLVCLYQVTKADETDAKDFALKLAGLLRKKIQTALPGLRFTIGIGSFYPELMNLHRSYGEAQTALQVGERLSGRDGIYHYRDMGIAGLWAQAPDPNALKTFIERTVGKVVSHDLRRKPPLLETLELLIQGDGTQAIADRLGVHQKTVVFRKKKIESILTVSLDDAYQCVAIGTALKLMKLLDLRTK